MDLGTRWSFGGEPPTRLSAAMKEAIRGVEDGLPDVDTSTWRWTLTWLERHPVAELEDGTVVREDYDGAVIVTADELDR
jgi:hypothetical protein